MKKILALALSLAMLLGAGIVQVSAMGTLEDYPYLFETYETEDSLEAITYEPNRADLSIAAGGANGSGGSLKVQQKNAGYFDITYPCTIQPEKGQRINMSVWVKLNSEILETFNNKNTNVVSFIFHGSGTVTNAGNREDVSVGEEWTETGWKQYDVSDVLVKDEWVKVTSNIDWGDDMSIGSGATIGNITMQTVALRVTGEAGTQALANPEDAVLDYQIDDFCVEYPDGGGVNPGTAGTYLINEDYDTWSSAVTGELDGRSEDCSPAYYQVLSPVGAEKFADITYTNVYLKPGHLYKVSGWFRYDGIEGDEGLYGDTARIRQIIYAGSRDTADTNNFTSGYPSVYPATIPKGEWTKVEYYYYYDFRSYDNHNYHVGFRICPEKAEEGQYATDDPAGAGTFGFDNIQVFDMGIAGNGDMEISGDGLKVFRNTGEVQDVFPGWNVNNANITAEASTDTPSGEGKSMKLTSLNQYGNASIGATLEQGKTYRISFKAKTEGLEAEDEAPIRLIFDRWVGTAGTTEVYEVPNYQYMIGPDDFVGAEGATQKWYISNEWREFTGWYTVNFPRKAGMEDADVTNVVPRRPMLYIYVNETSPADTVLYLDDFKVEEMASGFRPEDIQNGLEAEVTDISATGEAKPGSTISLSYTYVPKYSETENKSATVIRAYSTLADGNIRNYGVFRGDETFTVPNCAAGEDITFEIIPISTAGIIGNRSTYTVEAASNYLVYDAAGAKVTAFYEGASAKIIYAAYNGGRLTSYAISDATFTDGKFEETLPAEFTPGQGDTVKVMMWEDTTNCVPICEYAK